MSVLRNARLYDVGSYEICSTCKWKDDPVQSDDPDYEGGANAMSLNAARQRWLTTRTPVQ